MISLDDIKHFDLRRLDPTKIDLTKVDLRKVDPRKVELPTVRLPELPTFELPSFDLPKFELPDTPELPVDRIAGFARDAAYVGVGAVVVTAQRAEERRRELTDDVTTRVRKLIDAVA